MLVFISDIPHINPPYFGFASTESLLRVLTTHPTYQKVTEEYLKPEEAAVTPPSSGKSVNNNGNLHSSNGSIYSSSKKSE